MIGYGIGGGVKSMSAFTVHFISGR